MDRVNCINPANRDFFEILKEVHGQIDSSFILELNRSVSFGDVFVDRWARAEKLGFGRKTSIYDSSLVIGDVKVGEGCWIGPYTILDGSGGLEIGDYSTVSAGVHIYSHDNVRSTLSSGKHSVERKKVVIGNNTYLAPNVVLAKGVNLGSFCVVAVNSFVNKSFSDYSIVAGIPAKQIGIVKIDKDDITLEYFK